MKAALSLLFLMNFACSFAQKYNRLLLSSDFKVLNFNPTIQEIRNDYKVNTTNQSYHLGYNIRNAKFSWNAGISYQRINFRIVDRITHWNYVKYKYDDFFNTVPYDTVYQQYNDPADYVASSYNWGVHTEVKYQLSSSEKVSHGPGLKTEFYFIENFQHEYEINDEVETMEAFVATSNNDPVAYPIIQNHFFQLSYLNLSAFYTYTYFISDSFSIGARINVGTNLYAEWDKFKKCGWVGVGLELGFGH